MILNNLRFKPTLKNLKRAIAGFLAAVLFSIMLSYPLTYAAAQARGTSVKIGVLAYRGADHALSTWTPTADYLSAQLPSYSFIIVPLKFEEINPAIKKGEVDFILANSSIYVELENYYGVTRIATMKNLSSVKGYITLFGGVIFTKANRSDISSLEDLKGKSFMGVDETSLGGWRVAWREFKAKGVDPYHDFAVLKFGRTHDDVVYAVRDGAVDAGTVRTDILERMTQDGKIQMRSFRILNAQKFEGFPFVVSTRLYPEWPFAKVKHTPAELAQKVVVALLNMPEKNPAAISANIAGWTIPLDYGPVHEVLKELRVGPYRAYGKITLCDAAKIYWYWIALGFVFAVVLITFALYVMRLNRGLRRIKSELENARMDLELKVSERTAELKNINEELEGEIAERTHVEEVVRERDEQFRLLLSSVFEAIYGVDTEGNCTFCNAACLNMLGYEREEDLLGKNMHLLIHHSHADGTEYPVKECRIYGVFMDKEGAHVSDEVFWRADGSKFEVEYWSYPILKSGSLIGAVVTFVDITERRKMETEILNAQKLESLGVLAGGIAHDFNNILTAIIGNISIISMQVNPENELYVRCKEIENASLRAKGLTQQLITFSKGGAPVKKTASLLNIIQESAVFALRGSNVRCELLVPESLWPAEIDEGQISQVVHNLVLNAEQAMPSGGIIDIRAENITFGAEDVLPMKEGKYVKITFADQGIGIPKENIKRIFDPYFTTKDEGSGLGLAATYSIIKNHDGYITVNSEDGVGTTFTVYLPASGNELSKEKAAEDVAVAGTGRVLIMDDEEMVRRVAGEMLNKLGYAVGFARDGAEAIELYKSAKESAQPFDVVIMDLTIPGGMGGIEAMQRLIALNHGIKAIVSSGYSDDQVMSDYRKYGFAGVLIKPYKINQLSESIRKVLTSRP
jgi:two-component system sensor histidine kinase TtrS